MVKGHQPAPHGHLTVIYGIPVGWQVLVAARGILTSMDVHSATENISTAWP